MRFALIVFGMIAAGTSMALVPGRGAFERTLKVSGPVDLDVLSEIGGIVLTVGASGSVRIQAVLTPQFGPLDLVEATARIRALEANPPIEQTGNRIRIGYPADLKVLTRISMRLTIEVPRTTVVRARTGSGGIHISGTAGRVDGETRTGRIVISGIDGDVSATTRSGGIFVSNSQGQVVARNGSGTIEATGVAGGIDATTSSGAIRLSQTQPAPIRAHAGSGAINVTLVPGSGYDYLARSESGKILISGMKAQSGKSSRELTGKLSGGGPLVNISTNSSAVSIK
jgi:hypothetical protein